MARLARWLSETRPVRTPEAAYRTARHVVALACGVLMALLGVFFFVGFAFAPLSPGERRLPLGMLVSLLLVLLGAGGVVGHLRPRRRTWEDPPPARPDGQGLVLPRRRGNQLVHQLCLAAMGLFALGSTAFFDDGVKQLLVVAGGLVFLGVSAVARANPIQVGLTPRGLVLPNWDPAQRHVDWEEVDTVEVVANFHPVLVVTCTDGHRMTAPLHTVAWSPSSVLAAVRHFARHESDRERLTDPAALEPFRARRRR